MTPAELKSRACATVDEVGGELIALSHAVHWFAEPAFAEHRSSAMLARVLRRHGLGVRSGVAGLPTAFVADAGVEGPRVAVFCEYDALPGLGHACGHNVIAAAGIGAAIALDQLATSGPGRLRVVGSPAEEGGGGKVLLTAAGVLDGVAAALIVHPNAYEASRPNLVAAQEFDLVVHGRAAHSSLFPERGINALDAFLVGYQALTAIRPRLPTGSRIDGVLTEGGRLPNVVPDRARGIFLARGATAADLDGTLASGCRAIRDGASAVGARVTIKARGPRYDAMRHHRPLADSFTRNVRLLGRRPADTVPSRIVGSTDMGTVSLVVPAIHPMLAISPPSIVPHTAPFAAAAIGAAADRAVLDGAKAMAMTAIDVWTDSVLV